MIVVELVWVVACMKVCEWKLLTSFVGTSDQPAFGGLRKIWCEHTCCALRSRKWISWPHLSLSSVNFFVDWEMSTYVYPSFEKAGHLRLLTTKLSDFYMVEELVKKQRIFCLSNVERLLIVCFVERSRKTSRLRILCYLSWRCLDISWLNTIIGWQ